MSGVNIRKAAIVGCGFVGSSSAFTLMESGLFSELVLIDVDKERAQGEALDISHGLPFAKPMRIYAGDYSDIADASIIIVTAGAGQKPGETRLDLVRKNLNIFKSIIPQITEYNTEGILLIVANPVDILTYAAAKISGFPSNRVFGSGTVLDTARLKYLIGEHLGVDSRSVHACIIGEHGDSEIAAWSSANVAGVQDGNSGIEGIEGVALSLPAIVGKNGLEYRVQLSLDENEEKALRESAATLKSVLDAEMGE